ncbi:hypothetical protein [Knoellia sinensis]|uniref:hypothetical protein n=1 Tax=Knoellia sinensis TaxID=136100 RepID=UPI0012EC4B36|nr:hypothetical protein [Knoellia sinensis]
MNSSDAQVLPDGLLGAVWGSWPFLGIAIAGLLGAGRPVSEDALLFSAVFLGCGLIRAGLWLRHRRRNRVVVRRDHISIVSGGQAVDVDLADVVSAEWWFGHPSTTFDRMRDYAMLTLEAHGEELIVDLLLSRVSEQRRALTVLGAAMPTVPWRVGWSTVGDKTVVWDPGMSPKPPTRAFHG